MSVPTTLSDLERRDLSGQNVPVDFHNYALFFLNDRIWYGDTDGEEHISTGISTFLSQGAEAASQGAEAASQGAEPASQGAEPASSPKCLWLRAYAHMGVGTEPQTLA